MTILKSKEFTYYDILLNAWCLMDDEGKYELETYEPDIQGLDQCLDAIYSRQDEINELEKFKEHIIKAGK